jgi:hypothetical protein
MGRRLTPNIFAGIVLVLVVLVSGLAIAWKSRENTEPQNDSEIPPMNSLEIPIINPGNDSSVTTVDVYDPADPPQRILFKSTPITGYHSFLFNLEDEDYQTALNTDKLILLYFTTNDCSGCDQELASLKATMVQLGTDDVVAIVAHLNHAEATALSGLLAEQFEVQNPQTKVFIKNNVKVLKSSDPWNQNRYLQEISDVVPLN